jgi:hypothetical protein
MLAGIGRPIGMAEPLLHRGRLLMALDRPLMGGQLPTLGHQRQRTCAPHALLGLPDPPPVSEAFRAAHLSGELTSFG